MSDIPSLVTIPPDAGANAIEALTFIGRIGDGLVYSATQDGRPVTLREFAPATIVRRTADGGLEVIDASAEAAWRDACAQFIARAERLANLRHPALPSLLRVLPDGAQHGPLIITGTGGEPLSSSSESAPLAPVQVIHLADQLADALAFLHGAGLAHFDLSPETVAIRMGSLTLTDFALDNRAFIALTGSQDGFVRPGYSPIERSDATRAEPLGPATDIYSASALIYRLIEGRAPPPWDERWRDPALASLPDREPYPPAFLAAIRQGLAIEPAERFADGAAWRAALRAVAPPVTAAPVRPPHTPTQTPMPAAHWLLPLLIFLCLVALGGLIYIAIAEGWFERRPSPIVNIGAPTPAIETVPAPEPVPPTPALLRPGSNVAGRLSEADARGAGGLLADSFFIDAQGGEQLDISLSSSEFDPLLTITGPGLATSNDDDAESGGRNSRLLVTLPRPGRYTLTATSYARGGTGAYLLQVATAQPDPVKPDEPGDPIDLSVARQLSGRWRAEADGSCQQPALNTVVGDSLVSRIDGVSHTHRITATDGDRIDTIATAGPAAGRAFTFRLLPDGDGYEIGGETWLRC